MEAAKGVLVVLATLFVAADCVIPFFKREVHTSITRPVPQRPYCWSQFDGCVAPFSNNPYLNFPNLDYRLAITNINQLCQLYAGVADCLRPILDYDACVSIKSSIEVGLSIGDFVCSDQGRSLLADVEQNSPCLNDPTLLDTVGESVRNCTMIAYPSRNRQSGCQYMRFGQQCTVQSLNEHCGQASGELSREIYNRVIPIFYPNGCSNNLPRENLKRGFDLFRKQFI